MDCFNGHRVVDDNLHQKTDFFCYAYMGMIDKLMHLQSLMAKYHTCLLHFNVQ